MLIAERSLSTRRSIVLLWMTIVCFVIAIISYWIVWVDNLEISIKQYNILYEMVQDSPITKSQVQHALEDGKITQSEFAELITDNKQRRFADIKQKLGKQE